MTAEPVPRAPDPLDPWDAVRRALDVLRLQQNLPPGLMAAFDGLVEVLSTSVAVHLPPTPPPSP